MTVLSTKEKIDDESIARLAVAATVLSTIDMAIPSPLPGVKPGLANIVVLLTLRRFGWTAAVSVSLLRCLTVSLFFGSFMTPGFFLSLAGAISSLLTLGLFSRIPSQRLSCIGLSILAAFAHFGGQLILVYGWLIRSPAIGYWLPIFALAACITGTINGLIAAHVEERIMHESS